jgi:hypothetical protein
MLTRTESAVDDMVKRYGGDPKPFPLDHVYVLKPGSVLAMTEGKLGGGIHKPLGVKIGVEKGDSKLLFASGVAHELFHAKSPKSARVGKSGDGAHLYRTGISMIDRKDTSVAIGDEKEYFGMLEEAIVAECTKRLLEQITKEEPFREEAEAVKKIWGWVREYHRKGGVSEETLEQMGEELKFIADPQKRIEEVETYSENEVDRQAYAAGMLRRVHEKGEVESMERWHERKMMYDVLDDIVAKSNGKFKNRNEVFNEFARANFSGNYLPLARMVEGILGKGSFRRLANEFAQENKEGEEKEGDESDGEKRKRWQELAAGLEPVHDALGKKIDEGIEETVVAFLANDFPTNQSCEGHLEERFGRMVKIGPYVGVGIEEPKERFIGEQEIRRHIAEQFNIAPKDINKNDDAGKAYWDYIHEHHTEETAEYKEVRVKNEALEKRFAELFEEFLKTQSPGISKLRIRRIGPGGHFRIESTKGYKREVTEQEKEAYRQDLSDEQAEMAALRGFLKERFFAAKE